MMICHDFERVWQTKRGIRLDNTCTVWGALEGNYKLFFVLEFGERNELNGSFSDFSTTHLKADASVKVVVIPTGLCSSTIPKYILF